MTYDELVAYADTDIQDTELLSVYALRAVLELHKPWEGARMAAGGHNGPWCAHCEEVFDGSLRWPCPTIQAIQKALA